MRHLLPVVILIAIAAAAGCREEDGIVVHSITFQGAKSVDTDRLRNALATRQNTRIPVVGFLLSGSRAKNTFSRDRFETDLRRIEAFYADRGFPDAKVSSFDIKLNETQTKVDVTIVISEGDPVVVRDVRLAGFDVLDADRVNAVRKNMGLVTDHPRDRQTLASAREVALNELRDRGYPYAKADIAEDDGASGKDAVITLTAEPGPLSHFGPIEIVGSHSVSERVIRRQLTMAPGAIYRRSLIQDTQRRLYVMDLFQFVNIETLEPDQQNPEVKTRVTVAEGRHQRVNGGIGYGTEEKARVEGEYHHVNFLGDARSAGAHARWSSLDRGVRLDILQPYVFHPTLSASGEGQRWYTFTPAYESIVTGARLALTERPSSKTAVTLSLSSERNNSSISQSALDDPELYTRLIALGLDPTTGKQEGTLSAVGIDWTWTATDSLLDARKGYQIVAHVEEAGRLLPGTFGYSALSADARHYLPFGRVVWANRLQAGFIEPEDSQPGRVPFSKKFFLGGATSIRGWGRYEVSPLGGRGLPIGGNALVGLSSEARVKLQGNLGGVLFLDGGNVWTDRRDVDLGDLRYAAGLGLRYQTPVGPVRLDFGYQLNRIEGLEVNGAPEARRWRIHFSIGQAF